MLNEDFGTNIQVDKVAISIFGGVKLKGVLVLDHHNDTLISATRIQTNILSFRNIAESNLGFGRLTAETLYFHLKTYKGETSTNLDLFVKAFDNGKPGSGKFRMRADDLAVANSRFRLTNENSATPKILDFKKLNGELKDFYIKGSDISAGIQRLSLLDHRGLFVKNLKASFIYNKSQIVLSDLDLVTAQSALKGEVTLLHSKEAMKDFVNKVDFDFEIRTAAIASDELNYFYPEFGKGQKFYLSTHLKGPLNNFILHNLKLLDTEQSEIIGTVNFRNLFLKEGPGFYMNGDFNRVTSNYNNLTNLMPNILGKSLPAILEKFGRVELAGKVILTKKDIETDLYILSELGEAQAKLAVKDFNNPDAASYNGTINLDGFNVGRLINDKNVGQATLHLDVNGSGFNKESLNTTIKGKIARLAFNNYNYANITVDGRMRWPVFEGNVESNDPNLLMSFDGLVDMAKNRMDYDFHARVDYADLRMLNFIKHDTISIFKGDLLLDATGNTLNDIAGQLQISRLSYQNSRDSYYFEDFYVESVFDGEGVRTVTVNSTDIVEGRVTGKYDANELPQLIENALGSLYTNYSPHKVKPGQFLDFEFTIYNKIVEIVLPDVVVGQNTRLRGRINADKGDFQLSFDSPNIAAFENYFNNIEIDINNKNPLYNAYVHMDSVRMKNYKVSDFSLINVTQNDTLYLRSEFKGGNEAQDFFNLNLYHTIDEENRSVVGLKRSEINFKDYLWYLNENDSGDNKVIFNKKLTDFAIDKIALTHNDQKMQLAGVIRDSTYKDLSLTFNDISLEKITPTIDSLNFGGRLNGEVSLRQNRDEFQPASSLTIDSLSINRFLLGDLDMQITGDQSLRKFNVNTSIIRDSYETFFTTGVVEIADKQTLLSLDAGFTNFDISPLGVFLQSIFPDIRGLASGRASIVGNARKPEIDGRLYLRQAGLKVGYLNTDYDFEQDAVVDLTEELILFRNVQLIDTKHKTTGSLNGSVQHDFFKDWALDLRIDSDRLLVLDTEASDDALYYGTAFIKGAASISGPTTGLYIEVDATSSAGTDIKIPINNTGSGGASPFIHFLSPREKADIGKGIVNETRTYKGLEMRFDLEITPDALLEVIIDANTGHSLTANGYGNLLLEINTLGKFNMIGDFMVNEGEYNFRYAGLFDKKFIVNKNGYISWEGDPTRARLNLEAVYRTQANPSVLLETPTFSRNIPVEVVITLNGNLTNPEPDFIINFPGVSSVLKSDLEYRLSDMDTRQTQALSLLSTGSFLSPTNANTAVYGSLFEKASSLVNDLLSDDDSKVVVGLNYVQADRNPFVETNSQIGVTLSSQINDRITVNGQLGVPVGGVNESVIVGNVEVQLRINEDGTLKARVFNRENDINFLGEGIGYTQGVGLTYEVDFDTFREFVNKVFKNVKIEETDNQGDQIPDSELSPEWIQFTETRNKKKADPEEKQPQQIPETD